MIDIVISVWLQTLFYVVSHFIFFLFTAFMFCSNSSVSELPLQNHTNLCTVRLNSLLLMNQSLSINMPLSSKEAS